MIMGLFIIEGKRKGVMILHLKCFISFLLIIVNVMHRSYDMNNIVIVSHFLFP